MGGLALSRSRFGAFGTLTHPPTGEWDIAKMEFSFRAILNATAAGEELDARAMGVNTSSCH